MKSLLHCLWTGPSFPYGLRCFIKNWVQYLRKSNSDFQLVVWLTNDSYNATSDFLSKGAGNSLDQSGWARCMPGVDALFNRATLNFSSFYIAICNPLLANYPETLQAMFKMFHAGKRFTAVSNIGRLLILNACGGIYTDVDYLNPHQNKKFPKNLETIMKIFNGCSHVNFYLPATNLDGYYLVENQAAILGQRNIGSLTPLLRDMSRCMAGNFEEIYLETGNNVDFGKNRQAKRIERSMFTGGLLRKLMEAYKARDFDKFNKINAELFEKENAPGILLDAFGLPEENPPLLENGMRHRSYDVSGRLTYGVVTEFFGANLRGISDEKYITTKWNKFKQLFSTKDLDEQFQFTDKEGQKQGMYSWANPGYSRLSKLENAANVFKRRYISKNKMIRKVLLFELLCEAAKVKFGRLESKVSKHNRELSLKLLTDVVKNKKRQFLRVEESRDFLKKFCVIAFVRVGVGGKTNMGILVVKKINEAHFVDLKTLIDPEKKLLSYDDLESFALLS